MAEVIKILQSELATRPATEVEQAELDIRTEKIGKGEMKDDELFDKEEDKKPEVKEEKVEKKKEEKKEKVKEGEIKDADLLGTDDAKLDDAQKARKGDLVKAKEVIDAEEEDKRILEAEDKDLTEEQRTKKSELVKAQETHKTDEEKNAELDKEVKDYATEHSVSEEDARKDLESIGKIVENSKGDPKKLAKSYLHLQRAEARTKEELKATLNTPPPLEVNEKNIEAAIDEGKMVDKGVAKSREDLIEAYKEKYPDITTDVSDDTVFKMVVKEIKDRINEHNRGNAAKLSSAAKEKKAKLINDLPEDVKKYLPTMQPVLDRLTDAHIMRESFSLEDTILWSKGKSYDKDITDADARGFKRGTEARKIVGEITSPGEGTTKTKKLGASKTILSESDKKEAERLFENDDIPLATKYKHYEEMLEHDKELKAKKEKKDK